MPLQGSGSLPSRHPVFTVTHFFEASIYLFPEAERGLSPTYYGMMRVLLPNLVWMPSGQPLYLSVPGAERVKTGCLLGKEPEPRARLRSIIKPDEPPVRPNLGLSKVNWIINQDWLGARKPDAEPLYWTRIRKSRFGALISYAAIRGCLAALQNKRGYGHRLQYVWWISWHCVSWPLSLSKRAHPVHGMRMPSGAELAPLRWSPLRPPGRRPSRVRGPYGASCPGAPAAARARVGYVAPQPTHPMHARKRRSSSLTMGDTQLNFCT